MPKATTPKPSRRHNPLEQDILASGVLKEKSGKKQSSKHGGNDEAEGENYVDAKASRRVLELGRELLHDDEERNPAFSATPHLPPSDFDAARFQANEDEEDDVYEDDGDAWGDEDEVEEEEVVVEDLETFEKFNRPMNEDPLLTHGWDGRPSGDEPEPVRNLADLILAKIAEKEEAEAFQGSGGRDAGPIDEDYELPPKVVEVFTKIGEILSRYRSGPLPKPLKVLPTIPHWEDVLPCTSPHEWSPQACYAVTRIFISAKQIVATRFVEMVILDRVRDDIAETKKLNVHLFSALKRCLFKPASFFKGFLFPIASSGTLTQREAHIISGVLTRMSIPVLHSAAALKTLCDIAAEQAPERLDGIGALNILIKALLDKKYALPWQTVDALVFYFMRGTAVKSLPVLWHQAFLAFAQRYRNDITEDQRESLLNTLLVASHDTISPQTRRELLAGRGRGIPLEQGGPALDGDDTMLLDS